MVVVMRKAAAKRNRANRENRPARCRPEIHGKTAVGKQPYALALADRGIMVLAGLWENWRLPADEWVRTFAIVTTTPNELCAEIHNRMPVILKPEAWSVWLAEQPATRRR